MSVPVSSFILKKEDDKYASNNQRPIVKHQAHREGRRTSGDLTKTAKIQSAKYTKITSCEVLCEFSCEVPHEVGLIMPAKYRKIMQNTAYYCSSSITKNDVSARFSRKHAAIGKWRQRDSNPNVQI